jgi:hypothetical protein
VEVQGNPGSSSTSGSSGKCRIKWISSGEVQDQVEVQEHLVSRKWRSQVGKWETSGSSEVQDQVEVRNIRIRSEVQEHLRSSTV